jgi:hypothetical protein
MRKDLIPPRRPVVTAECNRYGLDPQQEVYAQLRASGLPIDECVQRSGVQCKSPKKYEAKNPAIVARITMLQDEACERVIEKIKLDKEWVVNELLRQYEANGKVVKAIDKMGNETHAPQKANEAIKCLELIGKELGMFVERKEIRVGALDGLSDEELARIAAELSAAIGFNPGTGRIEAAPGPEQIEFVPAVCEAEGVPQRGE